MGAVAPNEYIRRFSTLSTDELFFNDKEFKTFTFPKEKTISLTLQVLEIFYDEHCVIGDKFVEYLKGSCIKQGVLCTFCT